MRHLQHSATFLSYSDAKQREKRGRKGMSKKPLFVRGTTADKGIPQLIMTRPIGDNNISDCEHQPDTNCSANNTRFRRSSPYTILKCASLHNATTLPYLILLFVSERKRAQRHKSITYIYTTELQYALVANRARYVKALGVMSERKRQRAKYNKICVAAYEPSPLFYSEVVWYDKGSQPGNPKIQERPRTEHHSTHLIALSS